MDDGGGNGGGSFRDRSGTMVYIYLSTITIMLCYAASSLNLCLAFIGMIYTFLHHVMERRLG